MYLHLRVGKDLPTRASHNIISCKSPNGRQLRHAPGLERQVKFWTPWNFKLETSRNSAVGAFLRNSRISDSPTGAAPTNTFKGLTSKKIRTDNLSRETGFYSILRLRKTFSKLSKCFGVALGLFARNWTRGGAIARCRGWCLSRAAR